jgi:hypothetical protein
LLLVALAPAGILLRAQDQPQPPDGQAPSSPPAEQRHVTLRLPRGMMPPEDEIPLQPSEPQAPEEEAPPAQNLAAPVPTVIPPARIVSPGSQPTGPSLKIEYVLGKLSVTANQVPLSEVLREVSQKTGLEIGGLTEAGQVSWVQFSNLQVSEALQSLLSGTNYVLFGKPNSPEGIRQARVMILGATGQ